MIRRPMILSLVVFSLSPIAPRPLPGQAVALAAVSAPVPQNGASTVPAGCWACVRTWVWGGYFDACAGGQYQGWWNCIGGGGYCHVSSPGCGGGAALPVDLDGASQYVSVGTMLEVIARGPDDPSDVRRNCDGVIVARNQSPDDIARVRGRTGVLSL